MSDDSVELYSGIETSDINDKDILEQTRQLKQNGKVQYKFYCADGHVIKSEWINEDNARKGLIIWCDVVRNTLVARARESAAAKMPKIEVAESLDEIEEFEEQDSPIVLPPGVETRTRRPAAPAPPRAKPSPARKRPVVQEEPDDNEDREDEDEDIVGQVDDEDAIMLQALKAKRKVLKAKLAKLESVIALLQD